VTSFPLHSCNNQCHHYCLFINTSELTFLFGCSNSRQSLKCLMLKFVWLVALPMFYHVFSFLQMCGQLSEQPECHAHLHVSLPCSGDPYFVQRDYSDHDACTYRWSSSIHCYSWLSSHATTADGFSIQSVTCCCICSTSTRLWAWWCDATNEDVTAIEHGCQSVTEASFLSNCCSLLVSGTAFDLFCIYYFKLFQAVLWCCG